MRRSSGWSSCGKRSRRRCVETRASRSSLAFCSSSESVSEGVGPTATGVGTDIDPVAVDCARRNASKLKLSGQAEFVATSWAEGVAGSFDIVLSNPPYIATGEISDLAPEVAVYDPLSALDGGADGLDAYRALSFCIGPVLAEDGAVMLEIGAGQAEDVEAVFATAGFDLIAKRIDLAGWERALLFSRKPAGNG